MWFAVSRPVFDERQDQQLGAALLELTGGKPACGLARGGRIPTESAI